MILDGLAMVENKGLFSPTWAAHRISWSNTSLQSPGWGRVTHQFHFDTQKLRIQLNWLAGCASTSSGNACSVVLHKCCQIGSDFPPNLATLVALGKSALEILLDLATLISTRSTLLVSDAPSQRPLQHQRTHTLPPSPTGPVLPMVLPFSSYYKI